MQTKREKGTIDVVVQYMPEGVELEGATVEASVCIKCPSHLCTNVLYIKVADKFLSRFRIEQEKLPKGEYCSAVQRIGIKPL